MPFGSANAPASFQRALEIIFTRFCWKTCLVYLDDVVIFSNTVDEHFKHVDYILTTLHNAAITLKLSKCSLIQGSIEYLGHGIKPGKLEVDRTNTESLGQTKKPTTKSELRPFLGLLNFSRRFMENFTKVASPLNRLLRKGTPDTFTIDEDQKKVLRPHRLHS